MDRHNPTVSQVLEKNVFDYSEQINLNEIGYRIAFSIEGYHSREMKDDKRYVKYLVRIFGKTKGEEYEKFIPFHKCTEEDWAEFPPPAQASAPRTGSGSLPTCAGDRPGGQLLAGTGLAEQQHRGVAQKGAGNHHALTLPA